VSGASMEGTLASFTTDRRNRKPICSETGAPLMWDPCTLFFVGILLQNRTERGGSLTVVL
jgi:hypothetical protein